MHNKREKNIYFFALPILIVLMCLVIFKDFIFKNNLYLYQDIGSDTINSYYPYYLNFIRAINKGDFSFWLSNIGMGNNILSMQALVCDPFIIVLLVFGEKYLANGLLVMSIIKIICAGIAFYMYEKNFTITKRVRMLGALLYAFNGYMILWGQHYQFGTIIVLLPFLIHGYEILLKDRKGTVLVLSVALIAFFSSYFLFMASVFLFIYALVRYIDSGEKKIKVFARHLIKSIGCYIMGIGVSAIIFLPSLHVMLSSPRIGLNISQFPLFKLDKLIYYITSILRLFTNNGAGTGEYYYGYINYYEAPILYSGILTLIMIPFFLKSLDLRKKRIYSILGLIFIIFLILPHFSAMFNSYSVITYRWTFVINFLMITAAVHGLNYYEENSNFKKVIATVIGLLIIIILTLLVGYFNIPDIKNNLKVSLKYLCIPIFFMFIYTLVLKLYTLKNLKEHVKKAIIIVVIFELIISSYLSVFRNRAVVNEKYFVEKVGYNDYTNEAVQYIKQHDDSVYRIEKNYYSQFLNDNLVQNYYGIKTYNSINPGPVLDFLKKMEVPFFLYITYIKDFNNRHNLDEIAGVKYYLIKGEYDVPRGYKFLSKVGDIGIYINENFLPLGFTYDKYISESNFLKLSKEKRDIELLKALVVDSDTKLNIAKTTEIESVKDTYYEDISERKKDYLDVEVFKNGYLKGRINVIDNNKIMFLSIPYDKGWVAKVDGQQEHIIKGNIGFMAINLTEGEHVVEFEYKQPLLTEGVIITIVSLLLMVLLRRKKVL